MSTEDLFTAPDLYEILDFQRIIDVLFALDNVAAEKYRFPIQIKPLKKAPEQPKEVLFFCSFSSFFQNFCTKIHSFILKILKFFRSKFTEFHPVIICSVR